MTAISTAVAQREQQADNGPRALIARYATDFATVLPSHIKPEQWVRVAQGALKKGKIDRETGRYELEVAAENNPAVFLAALLDAGRLGLEPGTEQYYLTPRKVKGRLEILGIVGYQGLVELMYRSGAVASVVVECVFAADKFSYRPGLDDIPVHEIDWDSDDRGALRLVYAFARMTSGATSKVVVLNKADIGRIKKSSAGADYDTSPWKTNEPAMWAKSAARQLAKWVPTSAEHMRSMLRAARDVAMEPVIPAVPLRMPMPEPGAGSDAADIIEAEPLDAATVQGYDDAEVIGDDLPADVDPDTGEVIRYGAGAA